MKSKKTLLFAHGLVLLVGAIGILYFLFGAVVQIILFGAEHGLVQFDVEHLMFIPFVFLFIYSAYSTYCLIKKEAFEDKRRYTLRLIPYSIVFFATTIILLIAVAMLTSVLGLNFMGSETTLGLQILALYVFFFGTALTTILGIVGFFIDIFINRRNDRQR